MRNVCTSCGQRNEEIETAVFALINDVDVKMTATFRSDQIYLE